MFVIESERLRKRPEVRIGDKIFGIDDRLSTFERINGRLGQSEGGGDFEVIIGEALGAAAFAEILEMDLSYGVMFELVVIILAAIQDLPLEEARARFRGK